MRSIKFSDSELEFLRAHYEAELEAEEKYILQLKEILSKLGLSKKSSNAIKPEKEVKVKRGRKPGKKLSVDTPVKEKKKPGRKPKAVLVSTEVRAETETKAPESKQEAKKPVKRALKTKEGKLVSEQKVSAVKPEERTVPKKEAKKPIKRKFSKRRPKGSVFLTPLSKPLKKKEQPFIDKETPSSAEMLSSSDKIGE